MTKGKTNKESELEVIDIEHVENNINIDTEAIKLLEARIKEKKDDIKSKEYSISMTKDLLGRFEDYINNEIVWSNKEALGIIEIHKAIEEIKKTGISGGYVYMESLHLQASHYFLSKKTGSGLKEAQEFIELLKVFETALERSSQDVKEIKDLEKELAGLQQGLVTE